MTVTFAQSKKEYKVVVVSEKVGSDFRSTEETLNGLALDGWEVFEFLSAELIGNVHTFVFLLEKTTYITTKPIGKSIHD